MDKVRKRKQGLGKCQMKGNITQLLFSYLSTWHHGADILRYWLNDIMFVLILLTLSSKHHRHREVPTFHWCWFYQISANTHKYWGCKWSIPLHLGAKAYNESIIIFFHSNSFLQIYQLEIMWLIILSYWLNHIRPVPISLTLSSIQLSLSDHSGETSRDILDL